MPAGGGDVAIGRPPVRQMDPLPNPSWIGPGIRLVESPLQNRLERVGKKNNKKNLEGEWRLTVALQRSHQTCAGGSKSFSAVRCSGGCCSTRCLLCLCSETLAKVKVNNKRVRPEDPATVQSPFIYLTKKTRGMKGRRSVVLGCIEILRRVEKAIRWRLLRRTSHL